VPPFYYTIRQSAWREFGSTSSDLVEFNNRLIAGKPVRRALKRNRKQLQPGLENLVHAIHSLSDQSHMPRVPAFASRPERRLPTLLPLPKGIVINASFRLTAKARFASQ
jgi:hypothetical protein